MRKTFNFSAGPAVLPELVLQETTDEVLDYEGSDMPAMGISHKSTLFQSITDKTGAALRTLMNTLSNYEVLFLQGGTSLQFTMIPINFTRNRKADYIVMGYRAKKAYREAKLYGEIHVTASLEDDNSSHIPDCSDLDISPGSDYAYACENGTVYGTKFHKRPDSKGRILTSDISSCFLSKSANVSDYDMLFGGIQKNLGPVGLVVAIIRKDLISETVLPDIPIVLQYRIHTDKGSMYNTSPTYNTYIVGRVIKWVQSLGDLDKMKKIDESKAMLLYDYLDKSDIFCGLTDKDSRPLMNTTSRTGSEAFDPAFVEAAGENGIISVRGHRAVGGIRANLYNAMPIGGVQHLAQFMEAFEKSEGQHG